ncbi:MULTISPECIES: hypothetical protein [unclassified Gordonia (in: high G+C Gram-positive bacteria)]
MNIDYRPGSFAVRDATGDTQRFDGDRFKWQITDGLLVVSMTTTDTRSAVPYEVSEIREIYSGSWRLQLE